MNGNRDRQRGVNETTLSRTACSGDEYLTHSTAICSDKQYDSWVGVGQCRELRGMQSKAQVQRAISSILVNPHQKNLQYRHIILILYYCQ